MKSVLVCAAICVVLAGTAGRCFAAGVFIRADEVREAVKTALAASGTGGSEESEIVFRTVPDSIPVTSREYRLQVRAAGNGIRKGALGIAVDVVVDGRTVNSLALSVVVRTYDDVPVAARMMQRHATLSTEDLRTVRMETTLLRRILAARESIGQLRTKHLVQQGSILFDDLFEPVPLVLQGDLVTVRVRSGAVTMSLEGVARDDGIRGSTISVQVPGRRDRLRVRVEDTRTVVVPLD